jgi:hypothetical protein
MMKIKNLILLVLLILVMSVMVIPASFIFAEEKILFKTEVDTGYWDIWQHSDGRWQYTGRPGEQKAYDFEIIEPDEAKNYKDVEYEMEIGITKEQFMQGGGRPGYKTNDDGWNKFDEGILYHQPDNYRKTGDREVSFTLSPVGEAEIIKKDWQGEKVNGWRWYLPITVSWYGVPKTETDKAKAGGYYNIDDYLGLGPGDHRTYTYNHEKIGNGGTVTFKTTITSVTIVPR